MRKLKLQVQISVDGFIAGPNGEMDWLTFNWDEELMKYVGDITDPVDTIVLGRKLAEGFIPTWASRPKDEPGVDKMVNTPKVVFTQTLTKSDWNNTTLAAGDITEEVNRLKSQDGGDIIAYGGATFASALIKARLIDELHLFVNPVILGKGLPIFQDVDSKQNLVFKKSQAFPCGIVVLCYTSQPA
jgi:dihydrofolate reductase